jgi:hypothetical protein
MTGPKSVLVVAASPDQRNSTSTLRLAVDELRTRNVRVSVWFLRCWAPEVAWEGSRVVDSLRTWAGTEILSAIGLSTPAGWLRGLKLRSWLREVDPDVVILDDGIGERVVAPLGSSPVRILRVNETLPVDEFDEPRALSTADILITPPGYDVEHDLDLPHSVQRLEMDELRRLDNGHRMREPSRRGSLLSSLGVPLDRPTVVGWGDDGWIDGPDLFVRGLWTLAARHGLEPTGLWIGLGDDPRSVQRLRTEADRCGLGDRFIVLPEAPRNARYCGDVTFLPVRAATDADDDMAEAMAAGSTVVTFDVASGYSLPGLVTVPDLDLEAAAAEMASVLSAETIERPTLSIDVSDWVDRLLDLVAEQRAR